MELNNTTNALLTAIEARIKSVLDEVAAMRESLAHDAGTMPSVVSHLMIVRDSLEKLIPRLEDLPKEAIAEAIAPGVSVTIERIGFALTKLQREVEQTTSYAERGVERLSAAGIAALGDTKVQADQSMRQLTEALTSLRTVADRTSQATAIASASITRAATSANQQAEAATKASIEALAAAAPKSNHRLTAAVAFVGLLTTLLAAHWHWHRPSSALIKWASSPAGQSVYAFAEANPTTIGMLEACDLPGWRHSMVDHRAACIVASNRRTRYGWFLPQKK